ncbi:MAG: type IV pilus modification PilV family protein [Rubrobacter sp.]|nr:prepilin-type N-terminal cleavage/methylation domain-containing protein [Actinomycetota bacterium]MDQ3436061.1 prepilin-type N-terminal cleavage/methylation domain-containing protein [Actinomycetota bacterium]
MTSPINSTTDESGYSLVEVMVAIVVLTVAVVPMVGMFEAAIRAADASGDYDEARTCAVQKLEQVKSLPYKAVEGGLQGGVCAPSGFGYTIATQSIGTDLGGGSGEEGLSMITVTVDWSGENSYGVSGVVSRW